MHFPDLAPFRNPLFEDSSKLIAVGWLEPGSEYQHGEVGTDFARKLADLLVNPWQPAIAADQSFVRLLSSNRWAIFISIKCFCQEESRSSRWALKPLASWGRDLLCGASLVLHYMDSHEYSPPMEFKLAVMACSPMRSPGNLKALLKNGPHGSLRFDGRQHKQSTRSSRLSSCLAAHGSTRGTHVPDSPFRFLSSLAQRIHVPGLVRNHEWVNTT